MRPTGFILKGAIGDIHGIRELAARYLEWLKVTNHSWQTVYNREYNLNRFAIWCGERGLTRANEITKPIIDRYQRHLFYYRKANGNPLGPVSQVRLLTDVKMYFKWLVKNNHLLYNPASEIEMPKTPRRLPHLLTAEEMERVIEQPKTATPIGLRDRAILETLYSTGIRRKEIVGLNVNGLDVERGVLMVRQGKGMKDRVVPIGERAIDWVRKYLDAGRPKFAVEPDDGTLFITASGLPFELQTMGGVVRDYLDLAGIDRPGACHLFRHSMATAMLEAGADVRYIQEILGHAELTSTQLYTHVSIRKLKEVHTATHPAARLAAKAAVAAVSTPVDDLWEALEKERDDDSETT